MKAIIMALLAVACGAVAQDANPNKADQDHEEVNMSSPTPNEPNQEEEKGYKYEGHEFNVRRIDAETMEVRRAEHLANRIYDVAKIKAADGFSDDAWFYVNWTSQDGKNSDGYNVQGLKRALETTAKALLKPEGATGAAGRAEMSEWFDRATTQ